MMVSIISSSQLKNEKSFSPVRSSFSVSIGRDPVQQRDISGWRN